MAKVTTNDDKATFDNWSATDKAALGAGLSSHVDYEWNGGVFGGVVDQASALTTAAAAALAQGKRLRVKGSSLYLASPVVIQCDVDFDCDLVMASGGYLNVTNTASRSAVSLSTLSGLTQNAASVTGLPDGSTGKYVFIETTEVAHTRADGAVYTKSTAFQVGRLLTGTTYEINPPLPWALNAAQAGATATICEPERAIDVNVRRLVVDGAGTHSQKILLARDNVSLAVGRCASANGGDARSIIAMNKASGCKINAHVNAAAVSGYGYGVSLALGCLIDVTGSGGYCREAISGANTNGVRIDSWDGGVIDSHNGGNYTISRSRFTCVQWAGHNLAVLNCEHSTADIAVKLRADSAFCTGELTVDGLTLCAGTTAVVAPSNSWTAANSLGTTQLPGQHRMFDSINIRRITGPTTAAITLLSTGSAVPEIDVRMPDSIVVEDVTLPYANVSPCYLRFDAATTTGTDSLRRWSWRRISSAQTSGMYIGRPATLAAGDGGVELYIADCPLLRFYVDNYLLAFCEITGGSVLAINRATSTFSRRGLINFVRTRLLMAASGVTTRLVANFTIRDCELSGDGDLPSGVSSDGGQCAFAAGNRYTTSALDYPAEGTKLAGIYV